MKRQLLWLLAAMAVTGELGAQLNVRLQAEKDFYLLYEAIPLLVSLQNHSGRTLHLEGSTEESWLTFSVHDQNGGIVRPAGRVNTADTVLIPAGQTIQRTVDILPLFELRSRGSYSVQAQVNVGEIRAISAPIKFTILEGRELWSQTVGLPSADTGKDEYRVFTLLAHRTDREDRLYVSVKDHPPRLVYGVIPIGSFLPVHTPTAQIDREAHLHVLFQNAPRSFGYVEVDPQARIVQRAAFSDYMSRPRLLNDRGVVTVSGGEQIYPKVERILSEEELNPPTPPPAPAKKKKSWWPFGSKQEKPMGDELPRTRP